MNSQVFDDHKLTPNEFVFLQYIANNLTPPECWHVDVAKLEVDGYIKCMPTGYSIREKTFSLFRNKSESLDDFVKKFRELFPIGTKEGHPFRGDKIGCIRKMERFMKNYPEVTQDEILDATKAYIDSFKKQPSGYTYMKQAHYFIEKNGSSELAAQIEFLKGKQEIRDSPKDTTGKTFF